MLTPSELYIQEMFFKSDLIDVTDAEWMIGYCKVIK